MSPRTPETAARGVPFAVALALVVAVVVAALLAAASPAKAQAATFAVNQDDDRVPVSGACTDAPNDCTLREAVIAANNSPGEDTITFEVSDVTLSVPGAGEGESATGDLDISESVIIDGGDGVTVGATDTFGDRIFQIFTPSNTDPLAEGTTATIESLTIQDGQTTGTLFGGGSIFGGGIFVDGWAGLNLTDSVVQNNTATIAGGGIYLSEPIQDKSIGPNPGASATITNSVITENTAATLDIGNGQPAGAGGGIAALAETTLSLTDSEVTDNVSNNLSGGIANGGDTTITRSTISGNDAAAEAGGIGSGTTDGGTSEGNNLEIFDSTIFDNTARSGAGLGIINSPALVANSTISGNSTDGVATGPNDFTGAGGGAGVQGPVASLSLDSVTVAENSAPTSGGGALASDNLNAIKALNTIVADNTQGGADSAPVRR